MRPTENKNAMHQTKKFETINDGTVAISINDDRVMAGGIDVIDKYLNAKTEFVHVLSWCVSKR